MGSKTTDFVSRETKCQPSWVDNNRNKDHSKTSDLTKDML